MEIENTSEVETTNDEVVETSEGDENASAAPETETTEGNEEENHPGAEDDKAALEAAAAAKGEKGAATETPAFSPNFTVKAYGKEYEIPEKFRGLMTDEASSKEVRDVFEKSFAIDDYKPKQEQMRQRVEHYEQKVLPAYAQQDKIINECLHYLKTDDFESYFERLGVDMGRVMRWMDKRLSFTPEQVQLYNQNRELQKTAYNQSLENYQLKSSNESVVSDAQRQQAETLLLQFDYALGKGEYADKVKAYDEKNGASSFRNLAIKHGDYAKKVEGRELSFDEAIKEVIDRVAPASAMPAQSSTNSTKAAAPKEKPVLPVVKPRPVSPTAKQPRSIADIRKKAAAMGAANFDE